MLSAPCTFTRTAAIDASLPAGSLEAFAAYLHALGDAYSHRDYAGQIAQSALAQHAQAHLSAAGGEVRGDLKRKIQRHKFVYNMTI